jgi:hypothetical protein
VHDVVPQFQVPQSNGIVAGGDITGTLLVTDNKFENIHGFIGMPVHLIGFDADALIARNLITNVDTGIYIGQNSRPVSITDNVIVPGPFGAGNGIGAVVPTAPGGTFSIEKNTIVCESVFADGIYFLGESDAFGEFPLLNSVIENNDIEMRGSTYGAITLYGAVSDCLVRNNKIRGTGAYALNMGLSFLGPAVNNRFHGNNISDFAAEVPSAERGDMADVFLDVHSQDTVVHGLVRSVIDLGVDNHISGSK